METPEEFIARGGKVYTAEIGESGVDSRVVNFSLRPSAGYTLPSSGYHNIIEIALKSGKLRYVVKVGTTHYGTLPSLDLAILRRNKIWKKLGITEADFL